MKNLITLSILLTFSGFALAQSGGLGLNGERAKIQRYAEYNARNISITAIDGTVEYKSLRELDEQLNEAIDLYKQGTYDKAYGSLVELSQWGIKQAQMLLGSMYISGYHVEQSTVKGMAWLGVANEKKSQRQAGKIFKGVYRQLNSDQQAYIDALVTAHIEKFGSKAQNIKCRSRTKAGTNIRNTECNKLPNSNSKLYEVS